MIKKIGNILTTVYLFIMFCIYPFYMEDGYRNIGEAKNRFFLWVSWAGFAVLLIIYILQLAATLKERYRQKQAYLIEWDRVSLSDVMVLLYGTAVFLSYAFSEYKDVALWGMEGWYMGCLSLLLLCGLYFLISRLWCGQQAVFWGMILASGVVFLLGICNRFSAALFFTKTIQPEFISTLGNINWFCGYLSVIAPLGIGSFVLEEHGFLKKIVLGVYSFIAFTAGFCQGSSSVFLWFGALFIFLFWVSAEQEQGMKHCLFLLILWGTAAQTVRLLRYIGVGEYSYSVDNLCGYFTDSFLSLWIVLGAVICLALQRKNRIGLYKLKKLFTTAAALFVIVWLLSAGINTIWGISYLEKNAFFLLNEEWGHGRGAAFYASVRAFGEQPFLYKMIGAGPDCFAEAVYEIEELAVMLREIFGSARLTNAHNELLTALVNTGILGVSAYMGMLVIFIKECSKFKQKNYIPALCVFCYLVHNLVSFAQVLNFPYVFLIMGIGGAMHKRRKEMSPGC